MPRTNSAALAAAPRPLPSPDRADLIGRSHQRSVAHGLSRIERPDYTPLARPDLSQVRERNRRLFSQAAPLMDMLFDQISGTESMVVLCDAAGVVLHTVGDADFLSRASQVALQPGVDWSEPAKGTNAIGTALVEATPTLVHADEHFMVANHFLTCSAAPILDPRGHVLGVLDVTGDHRSYHRHTMALVRMTARMIENHWLSDQHQHALRVHFHPRAECLGTLVEGLLAVAPDGRVLGCNRSALELLRVDGAALRQRGLSGLLGCSVGQLIDRVRSPLATPLPVATDAGGFYVQARFGVPAWGEVSDAADAATSAAPAPPPGIGATPGPAVGGGVDDRDGDPCAAGARARWVGGASATDRAARAHALHAAGAGADAPLLTLRAAALTRPMLDDAIRLAGQGSLFIDDLSALRVPLQAVLAGALARPDGPRLLAGAAAPGALRPALLRHFGTATAGRARDDGPLPAGPHRPSGPAARAVTGSATPPASPAGGPTTGGPAASSAAPSTLDALQQRAIADAVAAAGGNISVAARQLGVSRNTVYRKLRAPRR
jgi:transcriptional regulator of acetoin/glycerol metabolism